MYPGPYMGHIQPYWATLTLLTAIWDPPGTPLGPSWDPGSHPHPVLPGTYPGPAPPSPYYQGGAQADPPLRTTRVGTQGGPPSRSAGPGPGKGL